MLITLEMIGLQSVSSDRNSSSFAIIVGTVFGIPDVSFASR